MMVSAVKKNITSSDVAKEAGVSRATVSYILNNKQNTRISDETRQRVLQAAKRLRYHQDINAQALKTQRSMSIGVVSRRNITETRFTNVLQGIKDVLAREKYSILLCSDEAYEMGYPEYYRLYHSRKIDGIIFISRQEQLNMEDAEDCAQIMLSEQIPCVFADYHLKNLLVNCIDINYFHGAFIAARHLIDKGYTKIAYLMPESDTEQERQRLEGVKQAVRETPGIELYIYSAGQTGRSFSDTIVEVLNNRSKHNALITSWGSLAAKTLYHACRMRIEVPGEIAVIALGWDDSTKFTYPKLSICELPLYELGSKSAQILLDNINNIGTQMSIKLSCKLNLKDSC